MPTHVLTPTRRAFLDDHFFQWSSGKPRGFRPDRRVLDSLTEPAELHYIAFNYNWDDDVEVLLWILDSPHCSRATANLLFWRALPSYFEDCDFDDPATCPDYCQPGFAVVKRVLEKYATNDFAAMDIAFDPTGETESVRKVNPHWIVPDGVHDRIAGTAIVLGP